MVVCFRVMSTVVEIKSAIGELPQQEFWRLAEWFDGVRARTWDEQMKADAEDGKLDFLFEEALPKQPSRAEVVADIIARTHAARAKMKRFITDEEIEAAKEEGRA